MRELILLYRVKQVTVKLQIWQAKGIKMQPSNSINGTNQFQNADRESGHIFAA